MKNQRKTLEHLFGADCAKLLTDPEHYGIFDGFATCSPRPGDAASVRGFFAPPFFSRDFQFDLHFDGRRLPAKKAFWMPFSMRREARSGSVKITTELRLAGEGFPRAAIMKTTLRNTGNAVRTLQIRHAFFGSFSRKGGGDWEFAWPSGAELSTFERTDDDLVLLRAPDGSLLAGGTTLPSEKRVPPDGVLDGECTVRPGKDAAFYTFFAVGTEADSCRAARALRNAPQRAFDDAERFFRSRAETLLQHVPEFSSGNHALERLYYRSILHFLMTKWETDAFLLKPYYSTGGINGGTCCCYLWNYGEPYRLWSLADPESNREHIRTFLKLDLKNCFAFHPATGSAYGPYYPVNHEKIVLLIHAYVTQTGDTAFLHETIAGRTVLQHVLEQALANDDPSKPAALVDYGGGNHHLELRRQYRYDWVLPDLNLRRCIVFRMADRIFRIAGADPGIDLVRRADELRRLIREKLYDSKAGWFHFLHPDGTPELRWTIQLFMACGWKDYALDSDAEEALLKHLNEREFLGKYGIHSMSKLDPAYDRIDIDNGGGGACVSFPPAVADRLYRSGRTELADSILSRCLWLADALPYWGDSQTADVMDYRRDTPLQADIAGTSWAQTMIFGLFGIEPEDDGSSVVFRPHLPAGTEKIALKNLPLLGKRLAVEARRTGFTVTMDGKTFRQKPGKPLRIRLRETT